MLARIWPARRPDRPRRPGGCCALPVLLVALALLLCGCNRQTEELAVSRSAVARDWDGTMVFDDPANPFLRPLPDAYRVHPRSAAMIAALQRSCGRDGTNAYVTCGEYSIPVYLADSPGRGHDVPIGIYRPAGKRRICGVPLVPGAAAAAGSDRHYAVIDAGRAVVHEFWLFDGRSAGGGNCIPLHSNGIYADGRSSTAAGWSSLQGLIWPRELRAGAIRHALVFACSITDAERHVPPATHHDGSLRGSDDAIPEGTLIRIRPDADLDSLADIPDVDRTIYRALQRYGMYCGDTCGAGLALRAVAAQSLPDGAWPDGFDLRSDLGSHTLPRFPFHLLEVVDSESMPTEPGVAGCAKWE